jgi:hypothetical protein
VGDLSLGRIYFHLIRVIILSFVVLTGCVHFLYGSTPNKELVGTRLRLTLLQTIRS